MSKPKLSFWSFLENSRMATAMVFYQHDGMPNIHPWGLISWDDVDLPTWMRNFLFPFNNRAFVHVDNPYTQIALYEWALDQCPIKSRLWLSPFLQKFEWKNLALPWGIAPSMGLCWVPSLNPTLMPLIQNLDYLSLWMSPSDVVIRYHTFLLNSLQSDCMNHVLSKLAL
jgi:hypothetical protein